MWSLEMIHWLNRHDNDEQVKVNISCQDKEFIPVYKHEDDAGADVKAFKVDECDSTSDWSYTLHPGTAVLVDCGFSCELPKGYAFLVCPRSGLALKNYITVLNAPGICDAGYRGSYGVILFNAGQCDFVIKRGDRIAQIVLVKTPRAEFITATLSDTDRGQGGFGSSGIADSK